MRREAVINMIFMSLVWSLFAFRGDLLVKKIKSKIIQSSFPLKSSYNFIYRKESVK